MENLKKELRAALSVDRRSLYLPDDNKTGSWFHQTSLPKQGQDLREPFIWSGKLDNMLFPLEKIFVTGVEGISIPLSNEDFIKLVNAENSSHNNLQTLANCASNDCCYIPSSKILVTAKSNFKLLSTQLSMKALEKALGFSLSGLAFSIDCQFKGLMLCQPGQKVSLFNQEQSNLGFLATVVLDLSVESGFKGGLLSGSHEGFETDFTFDRQESEKFYISIVSHDNTSAFMQPISEGRRAFMVFHMIWPLLGDWFDTRLVPTLLDRARRIRDCVLSSWGEISEDGSSTKADNNGKECGKLFFPLQYHRFINNLISYSCLPAEDRFALTVLSIVGSLDTNLAIINTDFDATDKNASDKLSVQIQQWFPSVNEIPAPKEKYKFDIKSQMVGAFQATLEREPKESVECYDYCYAVAVIQPRNESIRLSCRENFHAVLDYLEKKTAGLFKEESHNQLRLREQLLEDLRVIIHFCHEDPLRVWCTSVVVDCGLNITKRLWRMVLQLEARDEGLALLKLLSMEVTAALSNGDFDLGTVGLRVNNDQYSFCELIRDHEVVRLIAKFVSHVAGWDKCSDIISSMITLERLYGGRLFLISYLAQQLHANGLSNACFNIVEKIALILNDVTREQAYGFGPCDTRPFVALILYLMDNAKQEERQKFLPYLSYYSKFDPYDLYYTVIGFKWQFDRTVDSCSDLFRELCRLLSSAAFETSERLCDIDLVELVKMFQKAGDAAITETLLNNICFTSARDEPSDTPLLLWSFSTAFGISAIEQDDVEDGFTLLNAISQCQQAKEVIVKWLDSRVSEVENFVDNGKQALPGSLQRRYDYFIKEVTCYFLLIVLAEKIPLISNPSRLEMIGRNLHKFSTKLICHLVNVADLLEEEMADNPAAQGLFTRLTQEMESRDESEVVKQLGRLDLVRSFLSDGDSMMDDRTFATETAYSEDEEDSENDECEKKSQDSSMAVDADR